jgi:hypothetical protein
MVYEICFSTSGVQTYPGLIHELATTNPAINSNAENAIESFILVSLCSIAKRSSGAICTSCSLLQVIPERKG